MSLKYGSKNNPKALEVQASGLTCESMLYTYPRPSALWVYAMTSALWVYAMTSALWVYAMTSALCRSPDAPLLFRVYTGYARIYD